MKLKDFPNPKPTPQLPVLEPAEFNRLLPGDSICKRKVSRQQARARFGRPASLFEAAPVHRYKLKQGAPSKLFLKNSRDPGLLDVLDQFDYFERRHNAKKELRLLHPRIDSLWKLAALSRLLPPEPAPPKPIDKPRLLTKQSTLADAVASASPKFKRQRTESTHEQPQTPSKSKTGMRELKLGKKRSEVLESAEARPRRKCISFHNGTDEQARELLTNKFKILEWIAVSDCEEHVIVVFNECVTIDLQLLKNELTDCWAIGKKASRIFSSDSNLHALLGTCIDFVSEEYPGLDLLGFLGLLFIIHNDLAGFYKLCKQRFHSIRVDRQGLMRVSGESGVELRLDLFTDAIRVQPLRPGPSLQQSAGEASASSRDSDQQAFPRVLGLPRTASASPRFEDARTGGPFGPSLLELVEAHFAFAEAVHGSHASQKPRSTDRDITLEIDPGIIRRRKTRID